ncbi:NAD(+) diphosphatase [Actinomadura livida]|uniref:NAD(+) diphosphatase n=1 Tax=Actinomadura livida TaxID=79909 RepID=A0A7W7IHW2_9ACTN|nr:MULTISPECIES: NAD(+) diphosphatase [Actinomadura]MBB4777284.1 NAD+ diphosphatase [Actinomadura catellatispora]GGU20344.1 NUDIX hydrolase [Actinomadura livida]
MTEGPLEWLALARGTLDRVALHRRDDAWLEAAWADPGTRVLVVEDGRAPVSYEPRPALALVPPERAPDGDRWLLGVDDDGTAYFGTSGPLPEIEGTRPGGLRRVGALLDDRDSGLLTHAVALEHWHGSNRYCPRCGTETRPASAGHMRVCPKDESQHFPRVDPAVIMLVTDEADRILLARGPQWPADRRSILAGFVEPGESLEQAVAREVKEEVGVPVRDVRYLGSQPWPLPQSLMLGFTAKADGGVPLSPDPEEITDAAWYTRDELREAIEAGDIVAPGPLSIAAQLIMRWYGGDLPKMPDF